MLSIVQLENKFLNKMKQMEIEATSNSVTLESGTLDDCTLEAAARSLVLYYAEAGVTLVPECIGIEPCPAVGLCPATRRHRRDAGSAITLETSIDGGVIDAVDAAAVAELGAAAAEADLEISGVFDAVATVLEYSASTGSSNLATTRPVTLEYLPYVPEFTFIFPSGVVFVGLTTEIIYRLKGPAEEVFADYM